MIEYSNTTISTIIRYAFDLCLENLSPEYYDVFFDNLLHKNDLNRNRNRLFDILEDRYPEVIAQKLFAERLKGLIYSEMIKRAYNTILKDIHKI